MGVIGTGTLGPQIAQIFAECDEVDKVYLCKGRKSSTNDGKSSIINNYNKQISKGKLEKGQVDSYLSKIESKDIEELNDVDIVIEAISEDLKAKQELFSKLDKICKKDCILTTNTSSLPIKEINKDINRHILGMHFFNPAQVMKLVEVVVSNDTPIELSDKVKEIAIKIGKTPIEVKVAPGFVVNRVLIPMINEAISIYAEGIASVEDIDTALKLGANQPMGPLALGDLIGLDVVLAILEVMLKETGDVKYRPEALLKKMVRENKLGIKTNIGFYDYSVKK